MSAYGAINTPANTIFLPSTTWHLKSKRPDTPSSLTIHHLTLATAEALPGLVDYIHKTFADELERGQTYPQEILAGEEYTRALFDAYYFAKDVLVAVLGKEGDEPQQDGAAVPTGLAEAVGSRSWEESIAGCYYVSTIRLSVASSCDLSVRCLREPARTGQSQSAPDVVADRGS